MAPPPMCGVKVNLSHSDQIEPGEQPLVVGVRPAPHVIGRSSFRPDDQWAVFEWVSPERGLHWSPIWEGRLDTVELGQQACSPLPRGSTRAMPVPALAATIGRAAPPRDGTTNPELPLPPPAACARISLTCPARMVNEFQYCPRASPISNGAGGVGGMVGRYCRRARGASAASIAGSEHCPNPRISATRIALHAPPRVTLSSERLGPDRQASTWSRARDRLGPSRSTTKRGRRPHVPGRGWEARTRPASCVQGLVTRRQTVYRCSEGAPLLSAKSRERVRVRFDGGRPAPRRRSPGRPWASSRRGRWVASPPGARGQPENAPPLLARRDLVLAPTRSTFFFRHGAAPTPARRSTIELALAGLCSRPLYCLAGGDGFRPPVDNRAGAAGLCPGDAGLGCAKAAERRLVIQTENDQETTAPADSTPHTWC